MTNTSDWIESGGGPLVLVAASDVPRWAGIDVTGDDSISDYGRACAIVESIKPMTIRAIDVVVMGGEPDATSIASFDGLSHWVRWQWAPSEAALWDALSRADLSGLDWTTEGEFEARERAYRFFDSAFSGADVEQSLPLGFEPGRYVIETASFEPSSEISVLLHRFRRL